jgi:hypothetical protein
LTVTVIFSEPVASATATALANYQIAPAGGGANLTLSSATLTNQTEVILTAPAPTNALAFVLTVNNVRDLAGNQIQTNTQTAVTLTTILIAIDDVTLWSYENAGMDLGTAWKERNYNDSAWPKGAALLALESGATAEAIRTQLSRQDANGVGIITDYFRTHFRFSGDPATAQLRIRHVVDDGVAIYLNGTEVHRFFLPVTGPITATTVAVPSDHENRYEGPFDIPSAALVTGDNVIAAEVHQNSATSSDVVFGLVLEAIVSATPSQPPTITNTSLTGGNISIQWNGGGTLESAPSLSGPWTSTNDSDGSFSEAATGAGKYYRVRR